MDKNSLTQKQQIALRYLSDKMEATSKTVGEFIYKETGQVDTYGHAYRTGSTILGLLKKEGLVMRLPDLKAWRLTREGRGYVSER